MSVSLTMAILALPGCRKFGNFWDKDDTSGNKTGGVAAGPVGDISATLPAPGTYVNNTQVSFTLALNCSSASITWVRTGGAADAGGAPAGTHIQALVGAELLSGVHSGITLANNPTLANGAIYTVTFACTDVSLNVLTPVINTGVTYDTTLPVITVIAPTATTTINTTNVNYTLSEACSAGSITWTRTGGNPDPGGAPAGTHTQALAGAELASGPHSNITLVNNPTLADGAIYTLDFNCTDMAGNIGTTVSRTNVTYDFTVPVISAVTPANGASVNNTQVSYTLSENCTSGNVTWTRTGGNADAGGAPAGTHIQALTGGELNVGPHNNITLANNPTLVSGTIYTITFNCTDAAGQAATVITVTSVTYDNIAPVISSVQPLDSSFRSTAQVTYDLTENCATASITWTRTGGTSDVGGAPPGTHTQALTAGELTAGLHSNFLITNNPTLVDGAIYSIAFNCSDAAGNAATAITRTNVTFDPSAVVISAVAPAGSTFRNNNQVAYTLSEACATASITWTRTGGAADAGGAPAGTHVQALTGAELNAGAHGPALLANNPTLVDGTIYSVQFNCIDAAANASTPITSTNVTYDYTAPLISAVTPTASSFVNHQQVGYNFSEACATATVNWTWTGGTASGNFNQGLTGGELTSGPHGPFLISNNPVLVSGAIYTITFNCSDAAGNAATAITRTGVTFDSTPPTISIQNLRNNSTVHTGHVIGSAGDNVGLQNLEFEFESNATWNPMTVTTSWKFALPMGAATWRDRSQHQIRVRATDAAGNVTTTSAINVRKGNNQDINGDGYADVVVGAWAYSGSTGRAYVFYGSGSGIANTTAGAPNLIGTGAAASDVFGRINSVGDFNGDGFADAAIAAYGNTGNTGAVYIYPGGAGGLAGSPSITIIGAAASDKFGSTMVSGDTNNDGYADLVVGANGYSSARGRVYLFYGGGSGITITTASAASQTFTGETGQNNFSGGLALGDFNGDTYTDLAVGAPRYSALGDRGRGYMFYGTISGITGTTATTTLAFGTGEANADSYTGSMASGDVNGDGITDLVVGAYGYNAAANTGKLYLYYGGSITLNNTANPGTPSANITGTNAGAFFTTNMQVADLNSDSYGEIIVGAYGCSLNPAGCAYVFSGQAANITGSLLASTAGYVATGTTTGDNFGRSVASSDINGDGYIDLLVGANFYTTNTGRAYAFWGSASGPTVTPAASANTTLTGQTTNSEFGISFFR